MDLLTAFASAPCSPEDCESYLEFDPAISCCATSYHAFRVFAWLLVLLVPVGIPALMAYALFIAQKRAQHELQNGDGGELHAIDRTINGGGSSVGDGDESLLDFDSNPVGADSFLDDASGVDEPLSTGEGPKKDLEYAVWLIVSKHYYFLTFNYKNAFFYWCAPSPTRTGHTGC